MVFRTAALAISVLIITSVANAEDRPVLKTEKDKVSYSIGIDLGANFKRQSLDLNPAVVAAGVTDGFTGAEPLLSEEEVRQILGAFQQKMASEVQERVKQLAETNQKEGEAFLSANKKKSGVKTLDSGLQYKVMKKGSGKTPQATDTVTTQYKGTLIDGTEFDSSYERGEPASFPVNGVIKGWTEALLLMNVGSKWQLFIPSDLAYGPRGAGQLIGPNATLIFEVELVSIQ